MEVSSFSKTSLIANKHIPYSIRPQSFFRQQLFLKLALLFIAALALPPPTISRYNGRRGESSYAYIVAQGNL